MPRMNIPGPLKGPLASVVSIADEVFNALVESLRSMSPSSSPTAIVSRIGAALGGNSLRLTSGGILGALFSLYQLRDTNGVAMPEFIDDLGDAMKASATQTPFDLSVFKKRAEVLLDIPSLAISTKAYNIQREQPRFFLGTCVLRQSPNLFKRWRISKGSDDLTSIENCLHGGRRVNEFFVALDGDDLASLQKVIARAQAKARALAGLLEKTDLTNVS